MIFPKGSIQILSKLKDGSLREPFTCKEIYHCHHWSKLDTPARVRESLEILVENNILTYKKVKTGGRPKIYFFTKKDVVP